MKIFIENDACIRYHRIYSKIIIMISDRSGLPKVGSFQIAQKRSLSRKLNKSFLNSLPNFFLTIFDDFTKFSSIFVGAIRYQQQKMKKSILPFALNPNLHCNTKILVLGSNHSITNDDELFFL